MEKEKRTCPNCGNEIHKDSRFCVNCGAKLDNEVPPIPQQDNNSKHIIKKVFDIVLTVIGILFFCLIPFSNNLFLGIGWAILGLLCIRLTREFLAEKITNKKYRSLSYIVLVVVSLIFVGVGTPTYETQGNEEKKTAQKETKKKETKETKEKEEEPAKEEEEKTETKTVEEENTIADYSLIQIEDLLANPQLYAGKTLKIQGKLPQALILTPEGREIAAMNDHSIQNYVELRGGTPNFGGCEAIVTGNVYLENGKPIINAHSYESIGSTYSAIGVPAVQRTYGVEDTGTYIANYNMVVRVVGEYGAAQTGSIKQGEVVTIVDFVDYRSTSGDVWGKIASGRWVCMEDSNGVYMSRY